MESKTDKKRAKGTKTIKVNYLARVEGEGALYVKIKGNELKEAHFSIFEPPRFFEAFLRGRKYYEAPDITARICGICPIAYQMSSVNAMESAFGIRVDGQLRELRRLIYCGEWIESHVLHAFMLHAPDFLGYQDALQMAKDHKELVENVLKLKKIGNDIMTVVGGREIHPINIRVGGFYKAPKKKDLLPFVDKLKWGRDFMVEATKIVSQFEYPDFEQDYEFIALRHPDEYGIIEGRLVSNKGLDIAINEYDRFFIEEHVPYSTSLHSILRGRGAYMLGPLSRFNLNFDKLTPLCRETAQSVGFEPMNKNPFKSILARCIEVLYSCEESLRIIEQYEPPEKSYIEVTPREATSYGCTEAPRGSLYHRYSVDEHGVILDAKIVAPTSQNQKIIESDLEEFVKKYIDLPKEELTWKCEQAIRNYDPCISCSCHFLNLTIDRQ